MDTKGDSGSVAIVKDHEQRGFITGCVGAEISLLL